LIKCIGGIFREVTAGALESQMRNSHFLEIGVIGWTDFTVARHPATSNGFQGLNSNIDIKPAN
jgi:hypothetical protein